MRGLAREADDDSERLAGQEPCRWQSRLSEGLGLTRWRGATDNGGSERLRWTVLAPEP